MTLIKLRGRVLSTIACDMEAAMRNRTETKFGSCLVLVEYVDLGTGWLKVDMKAESYYRFIKPVLEIGYLVGGVDHDQLMRHSQMRVVRKSNLVEIETDWGFFLSRNLDAREVEEKYPGRDWIDLSKRFKTWGSSNCLSVKVIDREEFDRFKRPDPLEGFDKGEDLQSILTINCIDRMLNIKRQITSGYNAAALRGELNLNVKI